VIQPAVTETDDERDISDEDLEQAGMEGYD
jgi:hypothetical protein